MGELYKKVGVYNAAFIKLRVTMREENGTLRVLKIDQNEERANLCVCLCERAREREKLNERGSGKDISPKS